MANFTSNKQQVKKAIRDARNHTLESIGVFIDSEATNRCQSTSGELRDSIGYRVGEDSVTIGATAPHAPYLEFGTGIYAESGGRQTPWVYKHPKYGWVTTSGSPAQPFLLPAVEENLDRLKKLAAEAFKL